MERKSCTNCLLISSFHSTNCKRCGYDQFATIDDFVDQSSLNDANRRVAQELKDEAYRIEKECKRFEKEWCGLWDSDEDMEFNLISELEQEDYSHLTENID